ncbi:Hypothetical protein, putative [Bodo saltans]|uniref:Uncharacterized protein n=1 Tax=Bodo saltans TaxID=75058 RepID=A0A0S4ISZ7_BODSA|nr:Hypothetical protein, putative [Bodo saltans]|eukprot:CUG06310.1 Hypothetical protein, putative [Bodo saltans]
MSAESSRMRWSLNHLSPVRLLAFSWICTTPSTNFVQRLLPEALRPLVLKLGGSGVNATQGNNTNSGGWLGTWEHCDGRWRCYDRETSWCVTEQQRPLFSTKLKCVALLLHPTSRFLFKLSLTHTGTLSHFLKSVDGVLPVPSVAPANNPHSSHTLPEEAATSATHDSPRKKTIVLPCVIYSRVEPSVMGGHRMAELIWTTIKNASVDPAKVESARQ